MIKKVYSVFDSKAEAYLPPFMFNAHGEAIRAFTDLSNDLNHQFCKYSSDFCLMHLGDFDDSTGLYNLLPIPQSMGLAQEFKKFQSPLSSIAAE